MGETQTTLQWPILKQGSQGLRVKTLQYLLRGHRDAWRNLVVDGIFGPRTEEIVRAFQDFSGLTIDGIVGQQTWSRLAQVTARHGDTGEYVKAAQNELNRHGKSLDVDGIFGNLTDAAVREYQESVSLTVDGIVGPNTWRELITR
ncbi:MAG TPA: peptidoglycan-binding protein [Streptosporangiaceae bacterium]|nr:peptidoglycan-binding protein [Streptosporangiaceae bacterium]